MNDQFYADNEKQSDIHEKEIDLSMCYTVKTKSNEDFEHSELKFFCKDCKKIVKVSKKDKTSLKFICEECQGNNIFFGTQKSVYSYFHLNNNGELIED